MRTTVATAHRSAQGFTLIELMVTIAIIALLAGIAYPVYTRQVMQSRRAEAKAVLLNLAGRQERLYSTSNAYSFDLTALGYSTATVTASTATSSTFALTSGFYTIRVDVPAGGATFALTATAAGKQAGDTACATFTLNQTGAQAATGTLGTKCWH